MPAGRPNPFRMSTPLPADAQRRHDHQRLRRALNASLGFVLLLAACFAAQHGWSGWTFLTVTPWSVEGLLGLLTGPLLHGSFGHILANATALHADVALLRSNLLDTTPHYYDIILANLPYVDRAWERSPETNYEPELALFADKNGIALIQKLIAQAFPRLRGTGLLILEADPYQHPRIIKLAKSGGFEHVMTKEYGLVFRKP